MGEGLHRGLSEPQRLRRQIASASAEMRRIAGTLPESGQSAAIQRELQQAAWRLAQYWSWSEAGTHLSEEAKIQGTLYLDRLEAAAGKCAEALNDAWEWDDETLAMSKAAEAIISQHNVEMATFPKALNDRAIQLEMGRSR